MRRTAIRWASVAALVAVTVCLAAPASSAGQKSPFADWPVGTTAPPLGSERLVNREIVSPPLRVDGATTTDGPASFTRSTLPAKSSISTVALASRESPTPTIDKADARTGSAVVTQWCYYNWNQWVGNPPPPASGDSYGIARASSAGQSWTQSFESHGGYDSDTDSSTADTTHSLTIALPSNWPQPSRLIGVVNPSFHGQHFVDSNRSFYGDVSEASNSQKIRFGWMYNGYNYWDTLWNFQHDSHNAVDYNYTHSWPGNATDGEFAYIDAVPTRRYTFKFRVDAKATTRTEFLAGARSQIDYGSQGIDAPSLGPNNFVRQDHRVIWALIGYEVPNGWSVTC